jgi:Ca2+-binding EF-hand superfamily protein
MDMLTAQQVEGLRAVFGVFAVPSAAAGAGAGAGAGAPTLGLPQLQSVLHALGLASTESEVYEVLSRADTQGRGEIGFADFANLMAGELKDTVIDADLAEAFAAIDKDGDKNGTLQAAEIEQEIRSVAPEGTGAGTDVALTRADVEGLIAEVAGPGATGVALDAFTAMMKASL